MSRVWRAILRGAFSGVAVGYATGLFEVAGLMARSVTTAHLLLPAMFFYAAVWSLAAIALGLIRAAFGEATVRWYLAWLVPLALLIVAGGHVNVHWLPAAFDWRSLAFDAVFLAGNIGLGFWFYRRGFRWRWAGIAVALAGVVAIGIVAAGRWTRSSTGTAPSVASTQAGSKPNVLLITMDAARPDHLSVYGYDRKTSPFLETLARDGIVFTNAFAASSWTRASVPSLMTSRYPSAHNVNAMGSGLSPELLTLPEVLRAEGYATAIFSANAFITPLFGYGQGVDRFHYKQVSIFNELILGHIMRSVRRYAPILAWIYQRLEDWELPGGGVGPREVTADGLGAAFTTWMETLDGQPFFAYFHYMEPHTPYPTLLDAEISPEAEYQGTPQTRLPLHDGFHPFAEPGRPLAAPELANLMAHYDTGITAVDRAIGKLAQRLQAAGQWERTLIIVTADHGEEFYEHGGWGHGKSLFQELIHVPLIIRYPTALPQGKVIERPVTHVDMMPTILDLCGIVMDYPMEGRSLLSAVRAPEAEETPVIYSEVFHGPSYARAIIEGPWKLIEAHHHEQVRWLLFDLANDPDEQRPLDPEAHPRGASLQALLALLAKRSQQLAVAPDAVTIYAELRSEMRALGYIQ